MARQRRPTIKDVATAAGVAVSTVSNVLNDHPHVTDATRRKVLDAVEKLGYQASRAAKSLPGGRTHLIAYCLPGDEEPNPALDVFLHRIVATAAASSLEMLLFVQQGHDSVEPYRDLLRRGGADGFVLSGIEYDDERVAFLQDRDIPFVCFGRVGDPGVTAVDVDGAAGIAAAVEHVAGVGRTRFAFIGWPDGSATGDDRLRGYLDGVERSRAASVAVKQVRNDYDRG
ncbi:MAG: LacI family transcriptional regulator, partial [Acidimicrobiia bacterium]|nr:LacI family transcriptional regulator [Acidimicrobiia bacterium]